MDLTRRHFIRFTAGGLGAAALLQLMGKASAGASGSTTAGFLSDPPKARRAIHLCLMGGLSQVDSFDYKPVLARYHGKAPPDSVKPDTFFGSAGLMRANEWGFGRRGQSGLWVSDLFPHLGSVADELTVIHSMHSDSLFTPPSTTAQGPGGSPPPSMGAHRSVR